jgi:hypothetical protein
MILSTLTDAECSTCRTSQVEGSQRSILPPPGVTAGPAFNTWGDDAVSGSGTPPVPEEKGMIVRRILLAITISAGALVLMEQDGLAVRAPDGAQLVRQADGIAVSLKMPTPEPGTYVYPAGTEPGHPEVFTLWAFLFNHPENCSDGMCGPDDMSDPDVGFGAYNAAGHVNAGATLNLSGRIGVGDPAGGPPGSAVTDLSNPMGVEVHLAVTSHGGLDPSTLPGEFRIPTGNGGCGCWWVAIFD